MNTKISCFATLLAISALGATSASASFTSLGVVDGLVINGSSADGAYIVGQYIDALGNPIAMRWDITAGAGLEDLGELATGSVWSDALAASGDGSVVVGASLIENPNKPNTDLMEAFIWEAGAMTGLGFLEVSNGNDLSVATAISADGTLVAGHSNVSNPGGGGEGKKVSEAFIWEAGVMTGLGFLAADGIDYHSEALAVSGDGSVVVGLASNTDPSDPTQSVDEAFLWAGGVMTGLGFLQVDTKDVRSEATGVSYDGSTVIGTSNVDHPDVPDTSVQQAFVWADGVMTGLGFLADSPGPYHSIATAVSADGSVVVGESKLITGPEAFVWTSESNEMRSLREVLEADLGVDLTGWTIDNPPVISSDGNTMIALATNPDGEVEAFVTYLPEPAGGIYAGIALLSWLGRRRAARSKRASTS
ncbi:MAG: PEP-CTERM sorting domain-containing protein [Deltaproteobacteria bacterium]|jgi:probable HAF family extracellular repeat protein|nr:PEP-CTERM sorting domain-containing protein [Deltaproteobacteria bacterium]